MGEYIDREKAINEFAIRLSFYDSEWGNNRFTPDDVEEILQSIPAADVCPAVRGTWKKTYADHEAFGVRPFYRYCSECHEATVHQYNYCPNCGAKMDLE